MHRMHEPLKDNMCSSICEHSCRCMCLAEASKKLCYPGIIAKMVPPSDSGEWMSLYSSVTYTGLLCDTY